MQPFNTRPGSCGQEHIGSFAESWLGFSTSSLITSIGDPTFHQRQSSRLQWASRFRCRTLECLFGLPAGSRFDPIAISISILFQCISNFIFLVHFQSSFNKFLGCIALIGDIRWLRYTSGPDGNTWCIGNSPSVTIRSDLCSGSRELLTVWGPGGTDLKQFSKSTTRIWR